MSDLRIVGQMVLRNEADVVVETIHEIFRWVGDLVVLDGNSDDGTAEQLRLLTFHRYDGRDGKRLYLYGEPDPCDEERGQVNINHLRTRLMELTAPLKPDWVLSVDADEIYHYEEGVCIDPTAAIAAAELAGANVVRCYVPQFWLTFADLRAGALSEDETVSVQARRRWYSWGHMGTFAWRWNEAHYYPDYPSKRTPEMPGLDWRQWQAGGPLIPVCKHYPIRSLQQGLARAEARLERGGRWQFGKYGQRWLIDEQLAHLHYWDGVWQTEPNHERLKEYLSGPKHPS